MPFRDFQIISKLALQHITQITKFDIIFVVELERKRQNRKLFQSTKYLNNGRIFDKVEFFKNLLDSSQKL